MTPSARLSAAMAVLDEWLAGAAVEQALSRWARGARYAGSKDRAAVRDLVFEALRKRESAASLGGAHDGRGLILGLVRLEMRDPDELFTGEGHAPARLTAAERTHAPDRIVDPARDVPDWLRQEIAARAPDESQALFAAFRSRAPVWLRVARRRADLAGAQAALAADGIETRADRSCDSALEVTQGARGVRASAAFLEGFVELQDLSAQRAVAAVDWPETGRILDYCAGGGGKALAIADRTDARVFAHDIAERRMSDIPNRAARAGVRIELLAPGQVARKAPYGAVLCDVPCSGSGTWRRDPEVKWRLTPARLEELERLQASILDTAAPLVEAGGLLVYMTCSLLARENEDQVARFLDRSSGWRLEKMLVDTPLTASDGFFTANLRRTS